MAGISRRRFLTATGGGALAVVGKSVVSAHASAATAAERPLAGQWPRLGMDLRNTCFQPMKGKITQPAIAARTFLGGGTGWVMSADLDDDGSRQLLYLTGGEIHAKAADLTDRWSVNGLRPTNILGIYDLADDGSRQVVVLGSTTIYALSASDGSIQWQHDFGTARYVYANSMQIGKLDPDRAGLQIAVWPYFSEYGYAFAFDTGVATGHQIWQSSPAYANPAYLPEVVLGDVNADGRSEMVIAGYREVSAFDGATGARLDGSGGTWDGTVEWETGPDIDGRNYGHIQLVNLDDDAGLEVVDLADGVTLHAAVLQNDAAGMSLLWDKFIEYTENHKALRATINSVRDVDGDGRTEIVCCLYNDTGDERWHLLVADALTGLDSPKLDLPDRYLRGVQDFDGDGRAEILATVESTQTPGRRSTVELYAIGAGGQYQKVWSLPSAEIVMDPHADYPPTLSPASRNGRLEILRADPLASVRRRHGRRDSWLYL